MAFYPMISMVLVCAPGGMYDKICDKAPQPRINKGMISGLLVRFPLAPRMHVDLDVDVPSHMPLLPHAAVLAN